MGVVAWVLHASSQPAELLQLSAQQLHLDGVDAVLHAPSEAVGTNAGTLRLDALDELEGLLRAFVTDALWFVDAQIVVPISRGRIDFSRIDVEHIGPNSTLSIGPGGMYVNALDGGRIDLLVFDSARHAGTSGSSVPSPFARQGIVDVRALVAAIVQSPRHEPIARVADATLAAPLQRMRVAGELRLGDGALGSDSHHVELAGRQQGRNRMDVSSPAVGREVVVRIPDFLTTSAAFSVGGSEMRSATLSAALEARLVAIAPETGSAGRSSHTLHVTIRQAVLHDIALDTRGPRS